MARLKDIEWNLPENDGTPHQHAFDSIQCAVLMDLRDELRALNALLNCPNFRSIPDSLRKIAANTAPQKKTKR